MKLPGYKQNNMASTSSSSDRSMDDIMEVDERSKRGRGRGRGARGRGASRGSSRGGQGSRGRSRSGGRSQLTRGGGRGKHPDRQMTDKERVETLWLQRKSQMKNVVSSIPRADLEDLVLRLIDREPCLVFDLCEAVDGASPATSSSSSPSWCKRGNCQPMPTALEEKCCGCLPQNCISTRDQMDRLVLDPEVLVLGQRYY